MEKSYSDASGEYNGAYVTFAEAPLYTLQTINENLHDISMDSIDRMLAWAENGGALYFNNKYLPEWAVDEYKYIGHI